MYNISLIRIVTSNPPYNEYILIKIIIKDCPNNEDNDEHGNNVDVHRVTDDKLHSVMLLTFVSV
jgi:hypothetical protein